MVAGTLAHSGAGTERPAGQRNELDFLIPIPRERARALTAHGVRIDAESETFVASIQERAVCENPDAGPDGVGVRTDGVAYTLESRTHQPAVAHALRAAFDASEDGTGRGTPLVTQAFYSTESRCDNIPPEGVAPPLKIGSNGGGQPPAVAFTCKDHGADAGEIAPTLRAMPHDGSHANGGGQVAVAFEKNMGRQTGAFTEHTSALKTDGQMAVAHMAVRRLTPRECERLQGFPDDYTLIVRNGKPAADGPRYKALGNSMAVNCMRWIGMRIAEVERLTCSGEPPRDGETGA